GNSPNTVQAAAVSIVGKKKAQKAMDAAEALLEVFKLTELKDPEGKFDYAALVKGAAGHKEALLGSAADADADQLVKQVQSKGKSVFVDFLTDFAKEHKGHVSKDAVVAAVWATLAWPSLRTKKISKTTLVRLPWYGLIYSTMVGVAAPEDKHGADNFCGIKSDALLANSFTRTAFMALMGRDASEGELFEFQVLLGLIITNGPGTISAQGSKGAVSADGPEQPDRVQINKGFIGFLTHTGFAHGGNGYEAAAFLIDQFKDTSLSDPADSKHGVDLDKLATDYAKWYGAYKNEQKGLGHLEYAKIPCVNHPIFKGKDVNVDPREEYVSKLFKDKGLYNVFLDFYHSLVEGLFKAKVTKNVYCVNIDAVIAVILLKMLWSDYKKGAIKEEDIEWASFMAFLFGRMIGCAAEIDDHTNRGKNMDTRTPASQVAYVG
ncbi:MAG: CoA-binding protein, partial [Nitrospinota bacterium]|nr:CoA-binding protein [Nitrospinota bacterium]